MSTELSIATWNQGQFDFQRKLGTFVQYFQVNLPTNSHGIPSKLINPLYIAEHLLDCETTDDMDDDIVQAAELSVDFEDGIPIIDGVPIWERLDGEPIDYYKLFKEYREQLYILGARAVAKIAATWNILGRNLSALAKVYHWQLRCRAYDLCKRVEEDRIRQFAIAALETKHSKAADTMMEQALLYMEHHPEQMNHKHAVAMMQLAMKAGRLALGLNPEKPGTTDGTPNINISQTANGSLVESSVEVKMDKAPDISYLQSIIHILDKSNAFSKINVVEGDFIEVESS